MHLTINCLAGYQVANAASTAYMRFGSRVAATIDGFDLPQNAHKNTAFSTWERESHRELAPHEVSYPHAKSVSRLFHEEEARLRHGAPQNDLDHQ